MDKRLNDLLCDLRAHFVTAIEENITGSTKGTTAHVDGAVLDARSTKWHHEKDLSRDNPGEDEVVEMIKAEIRKYRGFIREIDFALMPGDAKAGVGPVIEEQPLTMSVPEAGKRYFGLARGASFAAAERGDIPTIRVGRLLRVPVRAMEAILNDTKKP